MIFELLSGYDFACAEYQALYARCADNPFQHPLWLNTFYATRLNPGERPCIVLAWDTAKTRLIMALPLVEVHQPKSLTFAFGGVTDHAAPIFDAVEFQVDASNAKLQLLRLLAPFGLLNISPVRDADVARWQSLLPMHKHVLAMGTHHAAVTAPFADWERASLSGNRRWQFRRDLQRLGHPEERCFIELSTEQIPEAMCWAQFVRKGRFPDDPLQTPSGFQFYATIAQEGAMCGFSKTLQLNVRGRPVALCFGVIHQHRYCYLLLAADYLQFQRCSPGSTMLHLAMEYWTDSGGRVFDFTIGDEPFKSRFGCTRSELFELSLA